MDRSSTSWSFTHLQIQKLGDHFAGIMAARYTLPNRTWQLRTLHQRLDLHSFPLLQTEQSKIRGPIQSQMLID